MSKKDNHMLLLGAHMSIAGGLEKSIERGESIGCTAIQIFTKSNRQWFAKPITTDDADTFKKALKNSPIKIVVAHAAYLINIGSTNQDLNKKSVQALTEELQRAELLGLPYLIFHPGAYLNGSQEECLATIASNLDSILENNPGKTMILIENTAGQGTTVGYTFDQLATIYKKIHHKKRIGFCFDTCHAFAAGYTFSTEQDYKAMWKEFDDQLGLKHVKAIHINDSTKGSGSRVDRHQHIGKGKLGLNAFSLLFNDPTFFDIPKILETPKEHELADDLHNMNVIKNLLTQKTKKALDIK